MRKASRGGIQKRRGPQTKTDRDGDLNMDAPDTSGKRGGRTGGSKANKGHPAARGSARSSPATSSLTSTRAQQNILRALGTDQVKISESRVGQKGDKRNSNTVKIRIVGLKESTAASNPDGGFRDLLGFLDRKAAALDHKVKGLKIKKSHEVGNAVVVSVPQHESELLLKLDQVKFAGTLLTITPNSAARSDDSQAPKEGLSDSAQQISDRIKGILARRYDINLKLLNLSALGKDPELLEMGMFDGNKRITKLFPVLMAVCDRLFTSAQAKRDAIVSVTLTDNELDNVSYVTALAQTFPDIQNLDMSRNKLESMKALESWRWRFRRLDNLVLTGNPLETTDYREEILKWYPTLRILNGVQVRSDEEVAKAIETAEQLKKGVSPIPINGPDFRDISQVGENFIRQFFTGYDTDRVALVNAFYDDESMHSLCINVSAPRGDTSSPASWGSYIKHSRNLVKLTQLPARINREHHGAESIKTLWASLPLTAHPNLATDFAKYVIDCHPISGLVDPTGASPRGVDGLIIMVHGEFEEKDPSTSQTSTRSFSRTFILGPGKTPQQPIRVINDALALRAHGAVPLPGSDAAGQEAPAQGQSEQAAKEAIMQQLVMRTQMTPEYATMCLQETGWDLEQAFAAFTANRDKLPPTAFIAQV